MERLDGHQQGKQGIKVKSWTVSRQALRWQGLFTLFMQDALRVKKVMREAQNAAGLAPGKALQRCAWPFWPQPGGKVVKTTPLVVALLAQPARLSVVARLDWRCFTTFALA
ncbi:MAG: hypothetical protein V4593_05040 [Pseudomonadota bacterium]